VIFEAPAIFVFTQVSRGVEELRDQIEIVGENLDTVEAGFDRVLCGSREVSNCDLNLLLRQRPGVTVGFPPVGVTEIWPGSTFDADTAARH